MSLLLLTAALAAPLECPGCSTAATTTVLDNGLTVVIEPQTRTDTVALMVRYDVGSRDEGPGEHGCAHLFEHLMFEGSANVPGNSFDQWLTDAGGSNNAWTSEDDTAYHMTFPSGALDLALFLESDRMGFLDAGIDPDNIANQQDVVLQERFQGFEEPNGRDWDALTTLLYPEGHPYHVPVIGTVADVEGLDADGVLSFWKKHYRPSNAVLILVGNVDPDHALSRVRHWFSDIPDPGPTAPRPPLPAAPDTGRHGVIFDDVEERSVYLTWPTIPRGHADEDALDLASWILDGGRGTRLADRLYYRRQLATDLGAYSFTSDLTGQFLVVASAEFTPLAKLERLVHAELGRLARKGPSIEELDRAKQRIRAFTLNNLPSPMARADLMLDCMERGSDPNCTQSRWRSLNAVTAEDVRQAVQRWVIERPLTRLHVLPRDSDLPEGATKVELP